MTCALEGGRGQALPVPGHTRANFKGTQGTWLLQKTLPLGPSPGVCSGLVCPDLDGRGEHDTLHTRVCTGQGRMEQCLGSWECRESSDSVAR